MGAIIAGIIKRVLVGQVVKAISADASDGPPVPVTVATKGIVNSKTAWGLHIAAAAAFFTSLGAALNGDPTAIGTIILTIGGWALGIYGRYKAGGLF